MRSKILNARICQILNKSINIVSLHTLYPFSRGFANRNMNADGKVRRLPFGVMVATTSLRPLWK